MIGKDICPRCSAEQSYIRRRKRVLDNIYSVQLVCRHCSWTLDVGHETRALVRLRNSAIKLRQRGAKEVERYGIKLDGTERALQNVLREIVAERGRIVRRLHEANGGS